MIAETAAAWGVPLQRIASAPGAIATLTDTLTDICPPGVIALLADGTPKSTGNPLGRPAGVRPADVLDEVQRRIPAALDVRRITPPAGAHGTILDEGTVATTVQACHGVSSVLSVGSGTVTDLGKAVAGELGVPLVVIQTAASVNGYSDALSVLVRNGAKRTVASTWPAALVIDHDVLRTAPVRLTRAGVGDAAAIWVAPADWYLACALGLDTVFVGGPLKAVTAAAEEMRAAPAGSAAAFAALVDTLTLGGLGIGVTGTTACISGVEHLISHLLDMAAMAADDEHDLHGAQVGVATVVSAALWEIALTEMDLGSLDPGSLVPPTDLADRVAAAWIDLDPSGGLGAECATSVRKKFRTWTARQDQVRAFFAGWPEHGATLRSLAHPPETPASALQAWSAPTRFSDLRPTVSADRARWVLRSLPYMRDRFTLADLLLLAGRWDDDLIERVLERAGLAGGGI